MSKHRLLRLVLRLDQAGSAVFILFAPALLLLPPMRIVLLWLVIGYAGALAALGVFMAWGLTRSMARSDELPMAMYRSLLGFSTGLPEDVSARVRQAGEDEQQVRKPVQVLHR